MVSVKAMASTSYSTVAKLVSAIRAIPDWLERHMWQAAAVVLAFYGGFIGTIAVHHVLDQLRAPVEAVSPVTIVQVPVGPTTIVTQIIQPPVPPEASRPTGKEAPVSTTKAVQAPPQESSTVAVPSSASTSVSESTSAPSQPEYPATTTSAPPEPTTVVTTPTSASETP